MRALTAGSSAVTQDPEARSTASSTLSENTMLLRRTQYSQYSENTHIRGRGIEAGELEDSTPVSPAYDELVEVVTHAVTKLNIYWPAEKQEVHRKSKLDERFLPSKNVSGPTFLSRPHTEGSRS